MSSNGWPHTIGHFTEGQASRFDMIFLVGSFCDAILESHLCRNLGNFLLQDVRPTSIIGVVLYSQVLQFCPSAPFGVGGGISVSILELILIDNLDPRGSIFCLRGYWDVV